MPRTTLDTPLGPLTLDNRIIIAPMCQYSAEEGQMQAWHDQHLGNLAQSGAGLLIFEASAVAPEGRITHGDVGLYDEACQQAMQGVVERIRRYSPMPLAVQIVGPYLEDRTVLAFAARLSEILAPLPPAPPAA